MSQKDSNSGVWSRPSFTHEEVETAWRITGHYSVNYTNSLCLCCLFCRRLDSEDNRPSKSETRLNEQQTMTNINDRRRQRPVRSIDATVAAQRVTSCPTAMIDDVHRAVVIAIIICNRRSCMPIIPAAHFRFLITSCHARNYKSSFDCLLSQ